MAKKKPRTMKPPMNHGSSRKSARAFPPKPDGYKVGSISAHWRNDVPEGMAFGFEWRPEAPDFPAKVLRCIEDAMPNWDRDADPADLRKQLAEIAADKQNLTDDLRILAMINIAWLESRGHLQADEFNGMVVIYGSPAGVPQH